MTDSVHDEVSAQLRDLTSAMSGRWRPMQRRIALPATWMRQIGARRFVRDIASSEAVATGRFHAVTTCLATRTPFLALASNTRKIEALLQDVFGNDRRLTQSVPELAQRIRSGDAAFSTIEKNAIDAYLAQVAPRTKRMFDRVTLA